VVPPRPGLFRVIAILGMLIGSLGLVGSIGRIMSLGKAERAEAGLLWFEPTTDQEAAVARRIQVRAQRVVDRHRSVTAGLAAANAAVSLLLLAGSLVLASGRSWARWLMVQGLIASAIYEVPAVVQEVRFAFEGMKAQQPLIPELLAAMRQPAPPDQVAMMSGWVLIAWIGMTLVLALLRLVYYGAGFWYLRRADVRAWFSLREP